MLPKEIHKLTDLELKLLDMGGFSRPPSTVSLGNNKSAIEKEIDALTADALTLEETAKLLKTDQNTVRLQIEQGSLYTISGPDQAELLPRFQFLECSTLPGLHKILPAMSKEAHPLSVQRFFLTPNTDLYSDTLETNLSPRDWLTSGNNIELVVRLAAEL